MKPTYEQDIKADVLSIRTACLVQDSIEQNWAGYGVGHDIQPVLTTMLIEIITNPRKYFRPSIAPEINKDAN